MLIDKLLLTGIGILSVLFIVYIFFFYFKIFFVRKKIGVQVILGISTLIIWQLSVFKIDENFPITWKLFMTIGFTLFAVINVFIGKFLEQCFFAIIFDALWMLTETLVGNLLLIYCETIMDLRLLGAFASKILFLVVIVALKKVFMKEEIQELSSKYSLLLIFIPLGSIYIMNAVFILAHEAKKEYAGIYSLVCVVILILVNVLVGYIYIKLADDLQVRHMNMIYEQQLELCERHQKETELAVLQMRDVKHNIKNHFISILAYAEREECERIINFINDIMEEVKLMSSMGANTGNVVMDSLVGYWRRTAENEGIEFRMKLSIPIEIPFKGADMSLILGNLLENAVEGAVKAEKSKYISLNVKVDKGNLLIIVENSYSGELIKVKEELRTTKEDAVNHGIGLTSVRRAVKKYHGTMVIDDTMPERFLVRVVLYGK